MVIKVVVNKMNHSDYLFIDFSQFFFVKVIVYLQDSLSP